MRFGSGSVTVVVFLAGAAIGFASPASADDFSGTYTGAPKADGTDTWTVTPCGPGCADVTSLIPYTAQAHLANGQWTMTAVESGGAACRGGGVGPTDSIWIWDAATLAGTYDAKTRDGACGLPDEIGRASCRERV